MASDRERAVAIADECTKRHYGHRWSEYSVGAEYWHGCFDSALVGLAAGRSEQKEADAAAYKAVVAENERLRREILAAGKGDFDWSVLARLDTLEAVAEERDRLREGLQEIAKRENDSWGTTAIARAALAPRTV